MSGLGVYVCPGIDEHPRNLRTIPPDQLEQERIAIRGFRIRVSARHNERPHQVRLVSHNGLDQFRVCGGEE